MAWTKFDTAEEKKQLQERALSLKPRVAGVIATELGWAVVQPRGGMELLVSFKNLDELLGDEVSETEIVGEPITIKVPVVAEPSKEPEVAVAPVVEVKEPIKPAVKKPGPKAKAKE